MVVRAQRRRVLPDHADPRHHVLLPAEGGGAPGLLATGSRSSTSGRWSSSTSGPARTTCSTPRCPTGRSRSAWSSRSCSGRRRWGGMLNGLLTLRGAWDKLRTDPVLKFFAAGVTFYGMATFEGPLLSIKIGQRARALHRLDHRPRPRAARSAGTASWRRACSTGSCRGSTARKLHSTRAADVHFWLGDRRHPALRRRDVGRAASPRA